MLRIGVMALVTLVQVGCPGSEQVEEESTAERELAATEVNEPTEGPGMDKAALPVVRTNEGIARHAGESALVRGTYVEVDVRQNRSPPPVLEGHVAIRLDDGTLVMLSPYWHDDVIRPKTERDLMRDGEVIAEGIINMPCPPNPAGANLQIPCIYPLLYVLTPEVHAMLHEDL